MGKQLTNEQSMKVERVCEWMDADPIVALEYLESEDWLVWNACQSIKRDRENGLLIGVAK